MISFLLLPFAKIGCGIHRGWFAHLGNFLGFHGISMGKSIGSGTIIDADGTILTCAHVVVDFQSIRQSSKGRVSSNVKSLHLKLCRSVHYSYNLVKDLQMTYV